MKKTIWTLEKLKQGFAKFHAEHGRYPTSHEIDAYPHLPSSRQIQRRFAGGLPALRQELKLSGPLDFTKGEYSSDRARTINKRGYAAETEVYTALIKHFGKICVHREYLFSDDGRSRTDFLVYHEGGSFAVDVFYPKDYYTLIGCINSKLKNWRGTTLDTLKTPLIFLMMNEAIPAKRVEQFLERKKNPLAPHQQLLTPIQFKSFYRKLKPLRSGIK